jgi:hypothetical protein
MAISYTAPKQVSPWGDTTAQSVPKPAPTGGTAPTAAAPPPTGVQLPLVKPAAPAPVIPPGTPAAAPPKQMAGYLTGGGLPSMPVSRLAPGVPGSTINPGAQQTQGQLADLAHQLTGGVPAMNGPTAAAGHVPGASVSSFGPGGDLRSSQVLPDQGVDRFKLAQQRYDEFTKANQQGDFDMTRAIGQRAGAAGRLGMGSVDDEYNRLARTLGDRNASARNSYLTDALEGTIGDSRQNRDEIRTERGYQGGAAQQHLDNQYRELQANQQIGYQGGSPWDTLLGGSGQLGQQAGQSGNGLYDLLRQYAYGRSVDPNLDRYGQPGGVQGAGGASSLYGQRPGTSYYGS